MTSIDRIINELGYDNSDSLFFSDDLKKNDLLKVMSHQTLRTLRELNPYAFYLMDNEPFVLFFEYKDNKKAFKAKHKEIWNAQTPVVIFDREDYIEIYNGYNLDTENKILDKVQELKKTNIDELSDFSYWNITSDNFWREFDKPFSSKAIDTIMLENIRFVLDKLQKKSSKPFAVRLTLRLIFIRYLLDRGIDIDLKGFTGDPIKSQKQFLEILKSKEELYNLFEHLKKKFNGNLFEFYNNDKAYEMANLDEESLEELYYLMSGELQQENGQFSLFPLYDFNIIPVELISNIYERLLGTTKQKADSAFYTPHHLVNYILKQTVKPHLKDNNTTCTVLDPACGSGIFLVETLRSIIEHNLKGNKYFNDNKKLSELLTENIFGIDKNEEACDVAIFSLYITLLDYKDPKCLKDFTLPILKNTNFFVTDFFDSSSLNDLKNIKFNFILGNPPWGSVRKGFHKEYCKKNHIPNPNNEIATSFLARAKDFSTKDTMCCLIVTSNIFYNFRGPAKAFRKWLLTETTINKYIELASVRKLIFNKAQGPAGIIFYKFNKADNKDNYISHITIKPNVFYKLFKVLVIETNDFKKIPQRILLENDWAWKTIVYGTSYDYYNVKQLKENYNTINNIIEKHQFASGTGIRTDDGNKRTDHLKGKKLIDSRKGLTAFKVDLSHSTIFQKDNILRTRNKNLFKPPYALFKKGLDITNFRLRAAFSEQEFLYRDTIQGISGKESDKETLLSLVGLLNSSLYAYLNLMLGASVGIEREQAFPTEVLEYPVQVDSMLSAKVKEIQDAFDETKVQILSSQDNIETLIKEMDEHILSMFNLQDNNFVRYVLEVQIPLLTGDSTIFRPVYEEELKRYVQPFIDYWTDVLTDSGQGMEVIIYPSLKNRFAAIEVKFIEGKSDCKIRISNDKNTNVDLVSRFALSKHNDLFYQMKDVINFEETSFYIVKTNDFKNWHSAIGELDLAKVIHSILMEGEDSDGWI